MSVASNLLAARLINAIRQNGNTIFCFPPSLANARHYFIYNIGFFSSATHPFVAMFTAQSLWAVAKVIYRVCVMPQLFFGRLMCAALSLSGLMCYSFGCDVTLNVEMGAFFEFEIYL